MRTIKFLGLAVALAAVSVSAKAQASRRFDQFTGFDNLARLEARQIERQQMRRFAMARAPRTGQSHGLRRGAMQRAIVQPGLGMRGPQGIGGGGLAGPPRGRPMMMAGRLGQRRAFENGPRAGMRLGARAGFRAGLRAGGRVNASPEQEAFARQFAERRQTMRAQVQAGTLTRGQARAQMKAWTREHRPRK